GDIKTDLLVGGEDGAGDGGALHDSTKDVDQHRLYVRIPEQNAKRLRHLLGVGTPSDVEEVARLAPMELDEIHRAHGEASAVDQATDVPLELHVAKTGSPGTQFVGVFLACVTQLFELRMAKHRVVVEGDLPVEGHQLAATSDHQRSDVHEPAIKRDEEL